MATTDLTRPTSRVTMVWPHRAIVRRDVADLRAEPSHDAELVDQAQWGEHVRVLGAHGEWRYVQGEDLYFGWCARTDLYQFTKYGRNAIVSVVLAPVRERPAPSAPVIAELPCGALVPETRLNTAAGGARSGPEPHAGWIEVGIVTARGERTGFVSGEHLADLVDLSHAYPTADDLLRTAASFLGVPYLWGGTTARGGMDCSGFVQQVYRLNGVALPRDADQQAVLGRQVKEARPGDLFFFGAESVTHVALATSSTEFLHAPMKDAVVGRGQLGGDRTLRSIRRYLAEVSEVSAA